MAHELRIAGLRPSLRFMLPAVLLAAVAIGLAACGGDSEPDPPPTQPADGVWVIDQDDLKFKPSDLTIGADEKVRFSNSESAVHTVTIDGENASGTMERDDVFEWSPPGPGEYEITCNFHAQMRATIVVE